MTTLCIARYYHCAARGITQWERPTEGEPQMSDLFQSDGEKSSGGYHHYLRKCCSCCYTRALIIWRSDIIDGHSTSVMLCGGFIGTPDSTASARDDTSADMRLNDRPSTTTTVNLSGTPQQNKQQQQQTQPRPGNGCICPYIWST